MMSMMVDVDVDKISETINLLKTNIKEIVPDAKMYFQYTENENDVESK